MAGILLIARLGVAQPTNGMSYELDAIAAAVIGGTSLMGGAGTITGLLIGAAIMGVLREWPGPAWCVGLLAAGRTGGNYRHCSYN